jgi:hypothetical protein
MVPQRPHFIKKNTDPDVWIIPNTQMIKISPFLWNGSDISKKLIFDDPFHKKGLISIIQFNKIIDPSTHQSHLV